MDGSSISRKLIAIGCAAAIVASFSLAGCAGGGGAVSYKDGTYTGQSEFYEDSDDGNGNGYGIATVTIEGGKIVTCDFKTYEPDGTLKDEDYGKTNGAVANQDFYNTAQNAVVACKEYAEQLVEVGNADGVDMISGATISYSEFQDAVEIALAKAAE